MLIHGLPENRNKNTDQIVIEALTEKMGEEIKEVDLDRTNRLGVRPITVKFSSYDTRRRIFRNKKKLKRKKVSITESLKKMRMEALKEHVRSLNFMFGPTTEISCTKIKKIKTITIRK